MQNEDNCPDIYFDSVQVTTSLFGVNFTLGLRSPHPDANLSHDSKSLLTARTSLKHAKVFAMLLVRQLKEYEKNTGDEIKLPDELYEQLKLDSQSW
jgi:hypothetical protein